MNGFRKRAARGLTRLALSALFLLLPMLAPARSQPAEELPEMEMLEFLGAFEDADAGWVDPFALGDDDAGNATREEAGHER